MNETEDMLMTPDDADTLRVNNLQQFHAKFGKLSETLETLFTQQLVKFNSNTAKHLTVKAKQIIHKSKKNFVLSFTFIF